MATHQTENTMLPPRLISWLQSLTLSYPLRSIRRDFCNGYLIAEILSKYYPADVEMNAFGTYGSLEKKKSNWLLLSKLFQKGEIPVNEKLINSVLLAEEGAAVKLLNILQAYLEDGDEDEVNNSSNSPENGSKQQDSAVESSRGYDLGQQSAKSADFHPLHNATEKAPAPHQSPGKIQANSFKRDIEMISQPDLNAAANSMHSPSEKPYNKTEDWMSEYPTYGDVPDLNGASCSNVSVMHGTDMVHCGSQCHFQNQFTNDVVSACAECSMQSTIFPTEVRLSSAISVEQHPYEKSGFVPPNYYGLCKDANESRLMLSNGTARILPYLPDCNLHDTMSNWPCNLGQYYPVIAPHFLQLDQSQNLSFKFDKIFNQLAAPKVSKKLWRSFSKNKEQCKPGTTASYQPPKEANGAQNHSSMTAFRVKAGSNASDAKAVVPYPPGSDHKDNPRPRIEYDKQPRPVQFKPYSRKDYLLNNYDIKQAKGYWELGKLGPDFHDDAKWRQKWEKLERQKNFGRVARIVNMKKSKPEHDGFNKSSTKPSSCRAKALSFAKSVPKPAVGRTASISAREVEKQLYRLQLQKCVSTRDPQGGLADMIRAELQEGLSFLE